MTSIQLRASTLADLVALPPYVLGFEPQESVVIVQLTDGLLAWAARCDNDQVVDADRARGLWQQLPVASGSGLLLAGGVGL
ncbi:MAG: hypothetical protein CR980_02220 [Propionibacteriales bacterium]|nr:MAG: hypothetical protein CR980_02220 [Propionibacteriales bacterium]